MDLTKRKAQLKAQLADLEAREREERRKKDNREKYILGGALKALEKADGAAYQEVLERLDPLITAKAHRAALSLAPLQRDDGAAAQADPSNFFQRD